MKLKNGVVFSKKKIRDIARINMGQSPSSQSYCGLDDGVPFFQGVAEFGEKHPNPLKSTTEPKKYAQSGDVLISVRAPVGRVNIARELSSIGRGLSALSSENNDLLYYLLKYHRKDWGRIAQGAIFESVNKDHLEDFEVYYPDNKNVRDDIVNVLNQQQSLIDSYKEKLSILEKQESYYKDELLSGRLRVRLNNESIEYITSQGWYQGGDVVDGKENKIESWLDDGFDRKVEFYNNEDWINREVNGEFKKVPSDFNYIKVKSLYRIINGYAFKSYDMKNSGSYPVIKMSNFKNKKVVVNKNTKWTDFFKEGVLIRKNDLLMGLSGSVGEFAVFDLDMECQLNQRCIIIRGDNFYSIKNIILPSVIKDHAINNAVGGVIKNLSHKFVENFEIPSLKDTLLISIFLYKIHNQKELIVEKIKVEEQRMEYLMDELLSGRIRIEE